MNFNSVLEKYRKNAFSEWDKGTRFEVLIKHYLKTDPMYSNDYENIWLWSEFPFREQFGGKDTGIDLVAKSEDGKYTAIQCKCYDEKTSIDKAEVDTFLSTSGKYFTDENNETVNFSYRLWVSTTNKWSAVAEDASRIATAIKNKYDQEKIINEDVFEDYCKEFALKPSKAKRYFNNLGYLITYDKVESSEEEKNNMQEEIDTEVIPWINEFIIDANPYHLLKKKQ